jgi:CheY-like chemotaxis protein
MSPPETGHPRILIVDDEPSVLASLRQLLAARKPEWVIETTTSPREALRVLGTKPFDVVISDIKMPEMDGLAFMRTMRARQHTVPVIFITAYRHDYADEVLKLGAFGVLDKPLHTPLLIEAIQHACKEQEPPVPPSPRAN